MTLKNFKQPAVWGLALVAYATFITAVLPAEAQNFMRQFHGAGIIVLLVRDIVGRNKEEARRIEREAVSDRKLDDVIFAINQFIVGAVAARQITDAKAFEIARLLEIETGRRRSENQEAMAKQTETIVGKIEEGNVIVQKAETAANDVNRKISNLQEQLLAQGEAAKEERSKP
jgi:hypothetical protein